MVNSDKRLYIVYQHQEVSNNKYHQQFIAYIKIIEMYGRAMLVYTGIVYSKLNSVLFNGQKKRNKTKKRPRRQ